MIQQDELLSMQFDHLFFDFNSLVHPCAQHAIATMPIDSSPLELEDAILKYTLTYTKYIIGYLRARRVYIMIDGVAPMAKLKQQRERRYKSYFFKKHIHTDSKHDWDSNVITPGTGFMQRLSTALETLNVEYLSDASHVGEGEHKMMKFLKEKKLEGTVAIYGLDADLIMLSLKNPCAEQIVLLRDNTFNSKLQESQKTFTYLSVAQLKSAVCEEVRGVYRNRVGRQFAVNDNQIIDDYMFLCFLLGNDFLEHLPDISIKNGGLNVLLKVYVDALSSCKKTSLVRQGQPLEQSVDLDVLIAIFEGLTRGTNKKTMSEYKDIPLPECDELHFLHNQSNSKSMHYIYHGISHVDEACLDYVSGMYWTLGYYNFHSHNNWSWFYKHHAPPYAIDVLSYLKRYKAEMPRMVASSLHQSSPNSQLEQLMQVLPSESLLPVLAEIKPELHHTLVRLLSSGDSLNPYYPRQLMIDMTNIEWLWQSKLFMQTIPPVFLKTLINE